MNEDLIDKYLNQSLSEDEEQKFLNLLKDEAFGQFLVKYCIEVYGYHSTAAKMLEDDLEKNKDEWLDLEKPKSGKWSLVALVAAAAILAICVITFLPAGKSGLSASKSLQVERAGNKILAKEFIVGDLISSKDAELTFNDGTQVKLNGILKLEELDKNNLLFLKEGGADFNVSKQQGLFKVKAGYALVEVIGTEFSVLKLGKETRVEVDEGAVKLSVKKQSIILHAGEKAYTDNGRIIAELKNSFSEKVKATSDPSLIFHMNFDGADPLSKKGLNGTAVLKKGKFTEGLLEGSRALQNGMIEIVGSNKDTFKIPMTINAWVKVNKETYYGPILTKGDRSWRLQLSENGMNFHGGFGFTERDEYFNSESRLKKGMWQMVTLVYTDKLALMYVDGKFEQRKVTELLHLNSEAPIQIGGNAEMPERTFDGLIDEVSIYNRPLSEEEVLLMYRRMIK